MESAQTFQLSIDKLKRQYGEKAEFVSRDGVRFNAFDEKWVLSTDGTSSKYIDTAWLYDYSLPFEQCVDLRLTLAKSAQKYKLETLLGRRALFASIQLESLAAKTVKNAFINEPNLSYRHRFKSICKQLATEYPEKYSYLATIFDNVALNVCPRKVFCEKRGALSEYEYYDLAAKLNTQAYEIINGKVTDYDVIRCHISFRLQQLYCARHSQVCLLKIGDFNCENDAYLETKELTFKLPLVKQKDDAQRRLFGLKVNRLSGIALQTFIIYLTIYKQKLEELFDQLHFSLSNEQKTQVFKCLPLNPHFSLFETDFNAYFSNAIEFTQSFSCENNSFNMPAKSLKGVLMRYIKRLSVRSDRVSGDIGIGVNRLRHTVAVHMSIDNKSRDDIALMLENTPKSAEVYVDLTDELRAAIDAGLSNHTMVGHAFAGKLTTTVKQGELTIEGEHGQVGKSGSSSACLNCEQTRPIACYGCQFFKPLTSADHEKYLLVVESRYNKQIEMGISINVLSALRNKILNIKATIHACQIAVNNRLIDKSNDD